MAGVRAARFLSLNDDMSGGAITGVALEVLFYPTFAEISLCSSSGIIAVHVSSSILFAKQPNDFCPRRAQNFSRGVKRP